MKRILYTCFFLLLTALMLSYPSQSVAFSLTGLTLWFEKMVPVLFPFMVVSGIMVRMNLTEKFAKILSPVLKPVFRVSDNGIYCMIMGFLCGFPMGAKVVDELYERGKLSRLEAQYLLEFCNNIGPIYFCSFVLPLLQCRISFKYLFGMYGLPLLYGFLSRRTIYRKQKWHPVSVADKTKEALPLQLLDHVDDAVSGAINSIVKLGGYMILFNLLNILPLFLLDVFRFSDFACRLLNAMLPAINACLEITSGISRLGPDFRFIILILLPFGGFSCIAQTYSIIKNTDLSIRSYVWSKLFLTLATTVYYAVFFFFSVR